MRAGISAVLLRQFERVSKFRGTDIAEVRNHKCMGCQVMLRPQTYNEVRAGQDVVSCDSCQRILYYDASQEEAAEKPVATTSKRRPRPKSDTPQAWFYRPDYGEEGEVFLVFENDKEMSSRRVYEAHSGRQYGGTLIREGNYRLAFPEDLTDSAIRLNGHWEAAEMEEWGAEMPMNALDLLHADLRAAQRESHSTHKAESAAAAATEHPAAS